MKKICFILAILFCIGHAYTQTIEVHDFDNTLIELNNEDFNKEIEIINNISEDLANFSFMHKYDIKPPHFEPIGDVSLSERLKILKNMIIEYESFGKEVFYLKTEYESYEITFLEKLSDLFQHTMKLTEITEKIIKSQSEDLSLALDEWNKALEDTTLLRTQLEINEKLARKAQEELNAALRVKQRVRFASYVELGIGIPTLILGCLPIWTDEQKNIQNLLIGVGATSTIAGGVGFTFTLTF